MNTKWFVDIAMEFDRILIPVILSLVGISVLNSTSSTSFLVFSVINTLIFTILVVSHKPPSAEVDRVFVFTAIFEGGGETQEGILEYATDDEVYESGDGYIKSLGYMKDGDVDNVDEITTQEQESDDNLLKTKN